MKINWYQIKVYAVTAIRAEFPVLLLDMLHDAAGSETPVSGNAISRLKEELRKVEESAKLNSSAKQGDQNEHHLEDH